MKRLIGYSLIGLVLLVSVQKVVSADTKNSDLVKVYQVNKRVSDFPEKEDLSTPEAAYATIMRDYMATGASGAEWSKISR